MNKSSILAACLAVAFGGGPARAWGPKGHEVVAIIAQDRLSAPAAAKVRELLGPGVNLDAVANCADSIRDGSGPIRCGPFSVDSDSRTTGWHVFPIPLVSSPTLSSLGGFCGDGCLLSAIQAQLAVLGNADAGRFEKQKALMYLVHFAGDIHQPLHCAMDDAHAIMRRRFGNTKTVLWKGKPQRLHRFWDQMLRTDSEARAIDVRVLAGALEKDLAGKDISSWLAGDSLRDAALESFRLAQGIIYPGLDESQATLNVKDREAMLGLVNERLERAGVRLAAWLEAALR